MKHSAAFAYYQFMRGQVQAAYDVLRQRREQRRGEAVAATAASVQADS